MTATTPETEGYPPTADDYARGIREGDSAILARAITLVESTSPKHASLAGDLLQRLLSHQPPSIRVGVTGVPGVGKSTFIEAFGLHLCQRGHRVAVLAVDPTSAISGGSILGDKTRMEKLSRHPSAYIRPSPSSGALGGVTRKTRETITLCEAAGYDVILVETVGVGQSEIAVRSMTDFFLLLALTGAGDELQGIKKGIVEMADGIVVTKADGGNLAAAETLRLELSQVLHFSSPATPGWQPEVLTCSALQPTGIEEVWIMLEKFRSETAMSGHWLERRLQQVQEGLLDATREQVLATMASSPAVVERLEARGRAVAAGTMTLRAAADDIARGFLSETL